MVKTKVREISIRQSGGSFFIFKKPDTAKESYDFSGILALRQVLTPEKARLLDVVKTYKPNSIYELSKKLGRDFKAVFEDVNLLRRFGFIDLISEKTNNRLRYKPVILVDSISINISI